MLRALLYLRLTSAKNRVRTQLARLRQPKYLLGTAFVVAYFWFFFFRTIASAPSPKAGGGLAEIMPGFTGSTTIGLLSAGVSLYLALMWVVTSDSPGIKFTQPEIAFLFPAPLSRRSLIHFKVISLQLSSLVQSCFFALIFNHRNLLSGHGLQTVFGWWAVLVLLNLHQLGSSLTIGRLAAQGVHSRQRRAIVLALLAGVGAVVCLTIWKRVPDLTQSASMGDWLSLALATKPIAWILWPAKAMLAPSFAHGAVNFMWAYLPALAILAAHYVWVVRTEVAFEDASIHSAERQAARLQELRTTGSVQLGAQRRSGRRPPFDVSRAPWPEFAFLWKNLLSTARSWLTARVWLGVSTALVLLAVVLRYQLGHDYWMAGGFIAGFGALTVGLTLLYGPLLTRLDFRQDLVNADILRTYPLPGWRILLGELLAPVVVLTGIIWFGLLAWFVGLHGHHPPHLSLAWFSPPMRLVLVGCLAILTPLVVALQLLVPNGAVVLFPGMFRVSHTPGGGLDLMGQRMIFGFGQFLALAIVFLPALGLAVASYFGLRGLFVLFSLLGSVQGTAPSPLLAEVVGTLVMIAVLTGEIGCGIWWLGGRFEKIDLSTETRA